MTEQDPQPTYADHAWRGTVRIAENVSIAKDTFRLRIECPAIAARVLPGQFVMLRLNGVGDDPLLGRPLALYDVIDDQNGTPRAIDIVYLLVGKMTAGLAKMRPGEELQAWGPLGNGFLPVETGHLIMLAGGIGQTPMLALAREYLGSRRFGRPGRVVQPAQRVTLCYGGRTADFLAGVEDFERAGVDVHLATDDGSRGHRGLVTDLLPPLVEESDHGCRLVCCGPEPMLKATAELAKRLGVACQVSLESPMACGLGICFSCVAKIRDASGEWDYRRTCVDGPVFDAERVEF